MVEESSRDGDAAVPSSVDKLVRRINGRPCLPRRPAVARALGPPSATADEAQVSRTPVADVLVTPANLYVTIELPGASRETLEVTATDARLTVHALDAAGGVFHSEIDLGHPVAPEAVAATYRNGVLDVTLPRRRAHRVRIERGD